MTSVKLCTPIKDGKRDTVIMPGFRSFEGKVFILSLVNLVWVCIGLIACMGLLLVKIGL